VNQAADSTEVLEPEVIPPGGRERVAEARWPGGVNPIIAGVLIDLVNLPLMGLPGFVAGAAVGYWAAGTHRLPLLHTLLIALAAGWYCGLPLPRTLPVATLVGVVLHFSRKRPR
jgi:hypothetical protein